jgi:group I intron endonuclease
MKIYVLKDKNNVPFYIGKSNDPSHRFYSHSKKYGKDIFLETIDEVENDKWKFWEQYWICQFKAWGFNLLNKNKGGGGPDKGRILRPKDQEWKNKIGAANKGKPKSSECKQKMSISRLHKPSNFLGKTHSDVTKKIISQIHSCKVNQYTKEGIFIKTWSSIISASTELNIQPAQISGVCKNKKGYNSAGGYKWKYVNNQL